MNQLCHGKCLKVGSSYLNLALQFNEHYTLVNGVNSIERTTQQNREKRISSLYKCNDLLKCPLNPAETNFPSNLTQSSKIIPLYLASSQTQSNVTKPESIDEYTLNSLLGSLSGPKNIFDQPNGQQYPVNQDYGYQPYQMLPVQGYPYQSPLSYPSNEYSQYLSGGQPTQANLYLNNNFNTTATTAASTSSIFPPPPSAQTQNTLKMRQVNCPPDKLRRVRCIYYDPSNPSSCAKGLNCTFLHQ